MYNESHISAVFKDAYKRIYVALKMDATYMQKDKIADRCEIVTIVLTSRFKYETHMLHIFLFNINDTYVGPLDSHIRLILHFTYRTYVRRLLKLKIARTSH